VPLGRLTYRSLEILLARELIREEHGATAALMQTLRGVRRRGWFTRAEFRAMCRWKSPRARLLWEKNSAARVRAVSRVVLATRDERVRMERLTALTGVGVPMASAILTLIDPKRYGVLDIRAWQLLFAIRSVEADVLCGGRSSSVRVAGRAPLRGEGFAFEEDHLLSGGEENEAIRVEGRFDGTALNGWIDYGRSWQCTGRARYRAELVRGRQRIAEKPCG